MSSSLHQVSLQPTRFPTCRAEVSAWMSWRRNVRALGGDIALESTPGRGSRTTLRLPLTLAIIDGQLVRVGSFTYIVPLLSIIESVQIDPVRVLRQAGRHPIYRLRNELVTMIDLHETLGIRKLEEDGPDLMVVVEAEGGCLGLLVDELAAQQQVVVKSLETNLERIPGLAGATILGDGSVSFILDPAAIQKLYRTNRDNSRAKGMPEAA